MKVFQSTRRLLAAQIIGIHAHPNGEQFVLQTDAEPVGVPKSWVEQHNPEIGGFVTIDPLAGGAAAYLSAFNLLTTHVQVGEVALQQPDDDHGAPQPQGVQMQTSPAADDPVKGGPAVAAADKPARQKPIRATVKQGGRKAGGKGMGGRK